jgi:hypothetical protein
MTNILKVKNREGYYAPSFSFLNPDISRGLGERLFTILNKTPSPLYPSYATLY